MSSPLDTPVQVFAEKNEDPIGTIALPTRDHIAAPTIVSLLMSDFRWTGGRPVTRVIVQGSQLPMQRNECVQNMQGDWLIFIDDDMTFGETAIGDLVATYHQIKEQVKEPVIVGGLCVRRAYPHQPTLYVRDGTAYTVLEDWEGDVIEIDATGAAFYLIETAAFEAIMGGPMPSIEERKQLPPWPYYEWIGSMGEDLRFCMTARDAGVRVFVDTRIRIGHLSEKAVGIHDFWKAVLERPQEVHDLLKEQYERINLPTMTRERAQELLVNG
jgi:hypothetical protein